MHVIPVRAIVTECDLYCVLRYNSIFDRTFLVTFPSLSLLCCCSRSSSCVSSYQHFLVQCVWLQWNSSYWNRIFMRLSVWLTLLCNLYNWFMQHNKTLWVYISLRYIIITLGVRETLFHNTFVSSFNFWGTIMIKRNQKLYQTCFFLMISKLKWKCQIFWVENILYVQHEN